MSDPDSVLELSEEAYDDLLNIQNYTFKHYGEDGWNNYGFDLNNALQHIKDHPFSGHLREDMPSAYLAWTVNEHAMIYRVQKGTIFLVRVLHSKMDFRFQFQA